MFDRLIRNATVVDPVNGYYGIGDVAIKDGRIAAVGKDLPGDAAQCDDASGLTLMPGLIDSHLHLGSMFGSPYGTRMAALAGVTTCLDMAGPIDEIAGNLKDVGPGINVAMLSGFEPKKIFGTDRLAPIAIRWVLMHPEVSVVIPGASRAEQVRNNVKAAELAPLTEEQMQAVKDIYDRFLKEIIHPQW